MKDSFIYVHEDGEWKIQHHHSSIMPEGIVTAEPITEKEVRGLFNLWNDGEIPVTIYRIPFLLSN